MRPNAFIDKPKAPTTDELAAALGPVKAAWDLLLARLAAECGIVEEWHSYSRKSGWALRLKVKQRNILYLAPCCGAFRVAFILGDKAVEATRYSTLPRKVSKLVKEGTRYPEGTAVRMEVASARDIPSILKLTSIKLQH